MSKYTQTFQMRSYETPFLGRSVSFGKPPSQRFYDIRDALSGAQQLSEFIFIKPQHWVVPVVTRAKTKQAILGLSGDYDEIIRENGMKNGSRKLFDLVLGSFTENYGNQPTTAEITSIGYLDTSGSHRRNEVLVAHLDEPTSETVGQQQQQLFDLIGLFSSAKMMFSEDPGHMTIGSMKRPAIAPTLSELSNLRAAVIGSCVIGPVEIY